MKPRFHLPETSVPSEKKILQVLSGRRVTPAPIWLMRQAGRYLPEYRALRQQAPSFLDFCYTPELAVEATLQPIRRFGLDAAILFSDILVVPDGLGQPVRFLEGEGPVLERIDDRKAIGGLSVERAERHLAPVYETVRLLSGSLPAGVALIGFAGAPWTVATYMVEGRGGTDFARVREWASGDPEGFGRLIEIVTKATIRHLGCQIEAGAEVVQVFDTWAGILPESEFRRWVIEPTARIVGDLAKRHPNVPVIGFPKGAGALYADYAAETGVFALGLDSSVPLGWARDTLQTRCAVQGNLDNVALKLGGETMRAAAGRILEVLGGGPLVFNLGHGILKETPPEHVADLIALVRGGKERTAGPAPRRERDSGRTGR
jgi:uroporphyrinogen decarboxylase